MNIKSIIIMIIKRIKMLIKNNNKQKTLKKINSMLS